MNGFEIVARNREEALEEACARLSMPAEALEVLDKGTGDEPLSGSEPLDKVYRIAVSDDYLINKAKVLLEAILKALEIPGSVKGKVDDSELLMSINSRDNRTLIGRKGEVLEALQHIISRVMTKKSDLNLNVQVDVGGYWEKRREKLIERVDSAAEKVLKTHRKVSLFPMPPHERKLVHITVKKFDGLRSFSVGKEGTRYVVISSDKEERMGEKLKN